MRSVALLVSLMLLTNPAGSALQSIGQRLTNMVNRWMEPQAEGDRIQRAFYVTPGQKLNIGLKTGGSVRIHGWDEARLSVDVTLKGRDWRECRVDFEQTSSGVEIRSDYASRRGGHNSNLEFDIRVPRQFDVQLETMGGAIELSGVEGRFRGSTMGGELNLSNLKGSVDLKTMGGAIKLTNSEVEGNLHTMGGDVVFHDVVGDVKGNSMGGKVVYSNVRTGRSGVTSSPTGVVTMNTMGGDIEVKEAPAGANVSTMGGDIRIGSAANFVTGKTMGGDIQIDAIDGAVTAETMGGNIKVTMVGNPGQGKRDVFLDSKGGEITLIVPDGLSMQFDVSLGYTRNSRQQYAIQSDFPLQVREDPQWDYSNGTPRKYTYGTGGVGGGKNRIKISTINGNIFIRRGR